MEKGSPVYQNGHTRYFVFGKDVPLPLVKQDPKDAVSEVWERHVDLIQTKIRNQEFDLLLIDNWMPLPTSLHDSAATDTEKLLKSYYHRTANINLPLANRPGGGNFSVQIWKPIPETLEAGKQHSE